MIKPTEPTTLVERMADLLSRLNVLGFPIACRNFPPPEKLVIKVSDADRDHIAPLRFGFSIDYAETSLT
ncbi:hypothetical protein [Neorhizobium sp. T6_25]|uniref:hypothetical protein n=1 Tax=Neorhizobium sp. T6_25 TaxID=2093833 RepID=UPI00155F2194|nr:hypothetical protein [Neorhizobium sp. T6_25]